MVNSIRAYMPRDNDIELSKEGSDILAAYGQRDRPSSELHLKVVNADGREQALTIPAAAVRLLADVLAQMAKGNAVKLMPLQTELTTQEAANLLNVSRPYLIKQLEAGQISYHKVGRHRRIKTEDLMAYKQKIDAERSAAIDEMVALSEEMGLYD